MSDDKTLDQIIDHLYGEMNPQEEDAFLDRAESVPALGEEVAQLRKILTAYRLMPQPTVPAGMAGRALELAAEARAAISAASLLQADAQQKTHAGDGQINEPALAPQEPTGSVSGTAQGVAATNREREADSVTARADADAKAATIAAPAVGEVSAAGHAPEQSVLADGMPEDAAQDSVARLARPEPLFVDEAADTVSLTREAAQALEDDALSSRRAGLVEACEADVAAPVDDQIGAPAYDPAAPVAGLAEDGASAAPEQVRLAESASAGSESVEASANAADVPAASVRPAPAAPVAPVAPVINLRILSAAAGLAVAAGLYMVLSGNPPRPQTAAVTDKVALEDRRAGEAQAPAAPVAPAAVTAPAPAVSATPMAPASAAGAEGLAARDAKQSELADGKGKESALLLSRGAPAPARQLHNFGDGHELVDALPQEPALDSSIDPDRLAAGESQPPAKRESPYDQVAQAKPVAGVPVQPGAVIEAADAEAMKRVQEMDLAGTTSALGGDAPLPAAGEAAAPMAAPTRVAKSAQPQTPRPLLALGAKDAANGTDGGGRAASDDVRNDARAREGLVRGAQKAKSVAAAPSPLAAQENLSAAPRAAASASAMPERKNEEVVFERAGAGLTSNTGPVTQAPASGGVGVTGQSMSSESRRVAAAPQERYAESAAKALPQGQRPSLAQQTVGGQQPAQDGNVVGTTRNLAKPEAKEVADTSNVRVSAQLRIPAMENENIAAAGAIPAGSRKFDEASAGVRKERAGSAGASAAPVIAEAAEPVLPTDPKAALPALPGSSAAPQPATRTLTPPEIVDNLGAHEMRIARTTGDVERARASAVSVARPAAPAADSWRASASAAPEKITSGTAGSVDTVTLPAAPVASAAPLTAAPVRSDAALAVGAVPPVQEMNTKDGTRPATSVLSVAPSVVTAVPSASQRESGAVAAAPAAKPTPATGAAEADSAPASAQEDIAALTEVRLSGKESGAELLQFARRLYEVNAVMRCLFVLDEALERPLVGQEVEEVLTLKARVELKLRRFSDMEKTIQRLQPVNKVAADALRVLRTAALAQSKMPSVYVVPATSAEPSAPSAPSALPAAMPANGETQRSADSASGAVKSKGQANQKGHGGEPAVTPPATGERGTRWTPPSTDPYYR